MERLAGDADNDGPRRAIGTIDRRRPLAEQLGEAVGHLEEGIAALEAAEGGVDGEDAGRGAIGVGEAEGGVDAGDHPAGPGSIGWAGILHAALEAAAAEGEGDLVLGGRRRRRIRPTTILARHWVSLA